MSNLLTIKSDGVFEMIIKKSRFIASFKKTDDEQTANEFIKQVKSDHKTANHNCSAYILGATGQIKRANDDGEPSGTAGIPMLEALENMNIKNVVVVVTRYFGGIKLGAGGLIRAYSHAVSDGVKAIGIVEKVPFSVLELKLAYDKLGIIENYLTQQNLTITDKIFTDNILLKFLVAPTDVEQTTIDLNNLLAGKADVSVGETVEFEVPIGEKNEE